MYLQNALITSEESASLEHERRGELARFHDEEFEEEAAGRLAYSVFNRVLYGE